MAITNGTNVVEVAKNIYALSQNGRAVTVNVYGQKITFNPYVGLNQIIVCLKSRLEGFARDYSELMYQEPIKTHSTK